MLVAKRPSFGKRLEVPPKAPPPPPVPIQEVLAIDRRSSNRRRVLQGGKLCFGEKLAFTVDCVIHDISDGGMRVQIESSTTIPTDVTLVHLRTHSAYTAKVTWQRHRSVGLQFESRHNLDEPKTLEMKALRQLCVEHDLRSG